MTTIVSARCGLLLACALGAMPFTSSPLLAQNQPTAAKPALPPGSPLIGRPDTPAAMALAPVPAPPLPTPADKLPVAKIKVPKGFKVEVYASGIKNARTLRVGAKGTVFVGNWTGNKVWAITSKGGKHEAKVLYENLDWPNGLALHNGTLYIAEHSKISKAENIEDHLDNPPKLLMIYDKLGQPRPHGWRFLAVGPDNKLYVSNSSPCNICEPPPGFGEIRRMNLDGTGAEAIVHGVRNTVGFDWNPKNKQLYFTDNNRDWMSEDLPNDKLNRITATRQALFGFPYCHQGNIPDPEFGWGHTCKDYIPPIALHGTTCGAARHALLHRQDVSAKIPGCDLHRPARAVESHHQVRRRCGGRASRRQRRLQIDGAVLHRLRAEQ